MALIKCSECGKEISDKATACPGCGCPVSIISKTDDNTLKEKNSVATALKALVIIQVLFFIAFLIFPTISDTVTTVSCYIVAALCVPCLFCAFVCIRKSKKSKGKITGVLTIILEIPLIVLFAYGIFFMQTPDTNGITPPVITGNVSPGTENADVVDDDFRAAMRAADRYCATLKNKQSNIVSITFKNEYEVIGNKYYFEYKVEYSTTERNGTLTVEKTEIGRFEVLGLDFDT